MLRYVAYILIVLTAVGLMAAVGVFLIGGLAARLGTSGAVRLTAFDGVTTDGPGPCRLRAMMEDAQFNRPILLARLFLRFDDGWTGTSRTSRNGACLINAPGRPVGRHVFTVMLSELDPRLGVRADGYLWVRAADTRVLWIDADSFLPHTTAADTAAGRLPAPALDALDAVKTLAGGRQVVYLVWAEAAEYRARRQALQNPSIPPGPAYWVKPGEESQRLGALRSVWPRVDGAVVCSEALAAAAGDRKIVTWRVPSAGGAQGGTPAMIRSWHEVLDRLTFEQGARGAREK